jgi:hypothetical protein
MPAQASPIQNWLAWMAPQFFVLSEAGEAGKYRYPRDMLGVGSVLPFDDPDAILGVDLHKVSLHRTYFH